MTIFRLTALIILLTGSVASCSARAGEASRPADLELVIVSETRLARLRLDALAGGTPVRDGWDRTFEAFFRFEDRDQNGVLDEREAQRLPCAFSLRQGAPYLNPGFPPTWSTLDRDANERVRPDELASYYQAEGLGGVQAGIGSSPSVGSLNAALVRLLDLNGDGRFDEEEAQVPSACLTQADVDEDELIAPGELIEGSPQPASTASHDLRHAGRDDAPLVVIPPGPSRRSAIERLFGRLDLNHDRRLDPAESRLSASLFNGMDATRDAILDESEFLGWFDQPADSRWSIQVDAGTPVSAHELAVGEIRLVLVATPGTLPLSLAAAARRLKAQFLEADTNRDLSIALAEASAPNAAELRRAIHPADRDADGALSMKELDSWLALQEQVVRSHATLSVIDHGRSLFELLDGDHDGRLSLPELATSRRTMVANGVVAEDGRIRPDAIPRTLVATLSQGRSRSPYQPPRPAPAWFQAMDRNHDGDVSKREYLGTPRDFDRLDADHDGLLNPREAAAGREPR